MGDPLTGGQFALCMGLLDGGLAHGVLRLFETIAQIGELPPRGRVDVGSGGIVA